MQSYFTLNIKILVYIYPVDMTSLKKTENFINHEKLKPFD